MYGESVPTEGTVKYTTGEKYVYTYGRRRIADVGRTSLPKQKNNLVLNIGPTQMTLPTPGSNITFFLYDYCLVKLFYQRCT